MKIYSISHCTLAMAILVTPQVSHASETEAAEV